jgi:glycosyltransferase involved in cell wall biosynthesis
MRIAITNTHVPFIRGGAELHAEGLRRACLEAGHEADIVTMPFYRDPPRVLAKLVAQWEGLDFDSWWLKADLVIGLKFPAYLVNHPNRVTWLLHQFREYYDLFDEKAPWVTPEHLAARALVREKDLAYLASSRKLYTASRNVSRRLARDCGIEAPALYHPVPDAATFYTAPAEDYILAPSRLEDLKRLDLVIEAMAHVKAPVVVLVAGSGTQYHRYLALIERLGLGDRVRLVGDIGRGEIASWYARALGVFFAPFDEDYGYITLEAMLAGKPVISTHDAGGPMEFVAHGETGFVVDPAPEAIAAAIEALHADRRRAAEMGRAGRARYDGLGINWPHVVETLTC